MRYLFSLRKSTIFAVPREKSTVFVVPRKKTVLAVTRGKKAFPVRVSFRLSSLSFPLILCWKL